MEVYLDNSATTRCYDAVRAYMNELFDREYGNPSSLHHKGVTAEQEVKKAREIIAGTLKADEKEILFTSGGTESDNLALFGTALQKSNARRGKHIVSTKIEHPAVLMPLKALEERGYEITLLSPDETGVISPESLKEAVRDDTILVSVMHTNNEIGSVQRIPELVRAAKEKNPAVLFHVDAVQGYGKERLFPKKWKVDLLSASAHKLHGPKGVGFLYVADGVRLEPILYGGGQQKGLRSGTENVQGIAGMAMAAAIVHEKLEEERERLFGLKEYLIDALRELPGVARINGLRNDLSETAPHIVSVSFEAVRAEVLLHALEEKGIYVSSGSACSSHKRAASETLQAIGLNKPYPETTVRFSFSTETTKEELLYTVTALKELLPMLSRFVRR